MSIKILQTADWHLGSFNGPTANGENLRFKDICNCLDALIEAAQKEQPDLAIISGDVFHAAKVWSDRGLKESQTAIRYIRELNDICPVVVVRGTPNHDSAEQYKMLKTAFENEKHTGLRIITEPQVTRIYAGGTRLQVACLPGFDRGYFRAKNPGLSKEEENEVFTQALEDIIIGLKAQCDNDSITILSGHYTILGCNMESGQTAFFSQFEPVVYPSTLNAADFDLVCFGHIHRPQQLEGCKNTYYSGAVSQLNFNDEGQERGFFIHDIDEDTKEVTSKFIKLPTREFMTIRLEDEHIAAFNAVGADIPHCDEVDGKIIRVLYNCTDEHNKAFNKTLMEEILYEYGAFYVQEITPQDIQTTVSKNALKEDDTPEDNLKSYLEEKEISDVDAGRIVELAVPIINEALEKNLTLKTTGTFTPIEIEVKNYRNYRNEKFSFEGIRFCTINGENGAGKSSLFMDAMCDCLFEETREGDITGWISNAEDARSGSIKFTFHMGKAVYRVTRTRMKSGKATLNLSELVDGEWVDRSREKIRDTQQEILNTIGMDSLTLKATALIMQDQYGLFLTADKDARMNILGNILGLGMYDDMYTKAYQRATEVNREIRSLHDKTAVLLNGVRDEKDIDREISEVQTTLDGLTEAKKAAEERSAGIKFALSVMEDAALRINALNLKITAAQTKKLSAETNITTQRMIVLNADKVLDRRDEITQGVIWLKESQEDEKALLEVKTKVESLTDKVISANEDLKEANAALDTAKRKRQTVIDTKLTPAQALLGKEKELSDAHTQYMVTKEAVAEAESLRMEYDAAMEKVRDAQAAVDKARRDWETGTNERDIHFSNLRRRAELLEESNCPYAAEVQCSFLKDALEAKEQIKTAEAEAREYQVKAISAVESANAVLNVANANVPSNYSPEKEIALKRTLRSLETSEKKYNELAVTRAELKNAENSILEYDEQIKSQQARISEIEKNIKALEAQRDDLCDSMAQYNAVVERIKSLTPYLEEEKKLPVAEEQKKTATARIEELEKSLDEYTKDIADLEKERAEQQPKTMGRDILQRQYKDAAAEVAEIEMSIAETNRTLGELERIKTETSAKRKEAAALTQKVNEKSQEAADLEMLKQAFSQDGIPHNIVRSVIPILEATATNILGQMSGGKMAVEFVMEKTLKSNNKKEVTTLDVVINDCNTGRLPYISRSGGERVKSALAVILALAEVKKRNSGVQVGFLALDEPPYLDGEGTQAYCDALEAIQSRYPDIMIMAITHDESFKARFPQSITVYKDEDGSHVRYDQ